jgi:hypothetical protein
MSDLVVHIVTAGNSRVNNGGRNSNYRPVASSVRLTDDELGKIRNCWRPVWPDTGCPE